MRSIRNSSVAVVCSLAFVAVGLFSCSKKDGGPSNPVSASTPAPVAGTPPPNPNPSPSASPNAPARGQACARLTLGTDSGRGCRGEAAHVYEAAVNAAISRSPNVNGSQITYFAGYQDDVVRALDAEGICAVFEADNLFVRSPGDEFNEYYDVITSGGEVANRYTNTCRPPVPTPDPPPPLPVHDPTCRLPASTNLVCNREGSTFGGYVHDAIEALIAEDRARPSPIIFDFSQALGGVENGYKVVDAVAYHEGVVRKLREQGLCAWWDSEDIQVKNTNRFSDHYDIYKAEGYRIELYTGTCRDAAF